MRHHVSYKRNAVKIIACVSWFDRNYKQRFHADADDCIHSIEAESALKDKQ